MADNEEKVADLVKKIAVKFARWIKEKGYIYAGEGDYMYPDADGLISGEDVFDIFLLENYPLHK